MVLASRAVRIFVKNQGTLVAGACPVSAVTVAAGACAYCTVDAIDVG